MKVRVYDAENNKYFISEVYAIINFGRYEKQLVLVPSKKGAYLKFFDCFGNNKPLINCIIPRWHKEWIRKKTEEIKEQLEELRRHISPNIKFFEFIGFPWVLEDKFVLGKLLYGESILLKDSLFEDKIYSDDLSDWNYIDQQSSADDLLKQVSGFHDSVLKRLDYISGGYVCEENKSMHPFDDIRKVTMLIESQYCNPIEMVFEGVTELNLRPAGDNYDSKIYSGSVYVKDAAVFFCDEYLDEIDKSYEGTWIVAYRLRWRFTK